MDSSNRTGHFPHPGDSTKRRPARDEADRAWRQSKPKRGDASARQTGNGAFLADGPSPYESDDDAGGSPPAAKTYDNHQNGERDPPRDPVLAGALVEAAIHIGVFAR
mgnify:CR=1 FL=1